MSGTEWKLKHTKLKKCIYLNKLYLNTGLSNIIRLYKFDRLIIQICDNLIALICLALS